MAPTSASSKWKKSKDHQRLSSINSEHTLRMRVFAGPNGSGKSTIIKSVENYTIHDKKLDFGTYVNADDIVVALQANAFTFANYKVKVSNHELQQVALASGLINDSFSAVEFNSAFELSSQKVLLKKKEKAEEMGQILADFLRKKLLAENKKFSFETVFSHPSKLSIMEEAKAKGYKVYLYFVSTSSPEINKERVKLRVLENGHDVPPDKIASRYFRSLDLMFDAAQLCHQAFFFDNSQDRPQLFTNFKMVEGKKEWKKIRQKDAPDWFIKYYARKVR